jgi:single-strand DNA-binding protein
VAGYNRIILVGNLTKDPELKQLNSGQSVCRLNIASNRQFKNRQTGMMVQEVCYIDVDVWGPQGENCRQYLKKGSAVLIEGRLKLDMWKDNEGQSRSKHSVVADRIVFLSSPQQVDNVEAGAEAAGEDMFAGQSMNNRKSAGAPLANDDTAAAFKDEPPFADELPF